MKKFLKNKLYIILLLALSVPAVIALVHKGFFGASDDLHIAWLFEMDKIVKIGQIPPRFVPDLSFGFGYPLFNFVFPLPFYLGEIIHLIGFSLVDSIKFVFGISLIASGLGMYFFLKEMLPEYLSLAGGLLYIYTPYRSTDVYIRGAVGEALSFAFLPLVCLSVIKIYKLIQEENDIKIKWKYISLFALSLAALILSHNIVSYMFAPFLLLLLIFLFLALKKNKLIFVGQNVLGLVFGLLVSSYFWIPAIVESQLMAYGTVFNFKDHFPTIRQLITPYFGYGASVPGPYDTTSFFIGLINLVIIVFAVFATFFFWKKFKSLDKIIFSWSFVAFFTSVFMMNYRSTFIWDHLPFLPYFQFPWRFLTLTTFISPLFLLPIKYLEPKYVKYAASAAVIVFVVFLNAKYFRPQDFLERTDAYYINRYIPVPTPSKDYMNLQEEYLRLPKETTQRPDKLYPQLFSNQPISFQVLTSDGLSSKIRLTMNNAGVIFYNKYLFPGWSAKIDNRNINIFSGHPFGQIAVNVPAGEHLIEFHFGEVWYKIILDVVSVTALLTLIGLNVGPIRFKR